MSIYVGNKKMKNLFAGVADYSAMRGPCPEGYHVPLNTEWQSVYDIWTALGGGASDGNNFGKALKLPKAGVRISSTSGVFNHGNEADYRSSSCYSTPSASYQMHFYSGAIRPQNYSSAAFGYSIRGFKDSPVIPTSSWTKLYGTSIEAGGIFWNSSEGLISLSSDGQTWIAIQDKNLGATQVYNNGDTLSEANCGKYYQWGNNYGFPWIGDVTTSSTRVNAKDYGPGNYYTSSTFITNTAGSSWDGSRNRNLRGGVTGITAKQTEAKAVYLGNTKVWESGPSLLTFEEINTLSVQGPNSVLNELNAHPEDYYNKFLGEGHTYITEQCPFSENNESGPFLSSDGTSIYFDGNGRRYFYNNKNKTIEGTPNGTRGSRSGPC